VKEEREREKKKERVTDCPLDRDYLEFQSKGKKNTEIMNE